MSPPAAISPARLCATEESGPESRSGATPAVLRTALIRSTNSRRVSSKGSSGEASEKAKASETRSPRIAVPASDRCESLREVGDEVFDVLDADGNADEARRDAEPVALRLGDRGV